METSSSSIEDQSTAKHTCLKLQLAEKDSIFIKGTWFSSHFSLFITDGLDSWLGSASEEDVRERASQWDQPVSEYIEFAEKHLGFQQPGSVYRFSDAGSGHRRLSFTFEREGTKLEWRWRCKTSPNSKETTAAILDFLMDANIRLSEEVVKKTESFEHLKKEAEKCLEQSEKLSTEKVEFESELYAKFVNVLNSKKAKLRELRDQLSRKEAAQKQPQDPEEEVSSDGTEPCQSGSDDFNS